MVQQGDHRATAEYLRRCSGPGIIDESSLCTPAIQYVLPKTESGAS